MLSRIEAIGLPVPSAIWLKVIAHADQQLVAGSSGAPGKQMLHRTRSIDLVVVMAAEIWCVTDEGEVQMRPGDVMVQRGTNHDWQNRSDRPAKVAFTLIDALPLTR